MKFKQMSKIVIKKSELKRLVESIARRVISESGDVDFQNQDIDDLISRNFKLRGGSRDRFNDPLGKAKNKEARLAAMADFQKDFEEERSPKPEKAYRFRCKRRKHPRRPEDLFSDSIKDFSPSFSKSYCEDFGYDILFCDDIHKDWVLSVIQSDFEDLSEYRRWLRARKLIEIRRRKTNPNITDLELDTRAAIAANIQDYRGWKAMSDERKSATEMDNEIVNF